MTYSEHFLKRKQDHEKAKESYFDGLADTALASSMTFMPILAPLAVAIYKAFSSAKIEAKAKKAMHPTEMDSRYLPNQMGDLSIQDGLMFGLGMELGEFKDWKAYATENAGRQLSKNEELDLFARMLPSFSPTMIIDDLLTRHIAFSAQTGSGKTETMFAVADQQFARGGGMIIFEAKGKEGDYGVIEKITALADQHGRLDDVEYFSVDDAKNCMSWNPWVAKDPKALISMAMALQPTDGDQYFKDMNKYGLTAAILALRYQIKPRAFCFKDLMAIFSDADILIGLHKTMSSSTSAARTAKNYVNTVLTNFMTQDRRTKQNEFNYDMYQSRFSGLGATVGNFCHSEYSEIINSLTPDIDITKSIQNNKITIISVSTLTDKEGVSTLGQIFMADLARAIGELLKTGTKPLIPCITWLDEYPSFKSEAHQSLFQLVRAANIGMIISFQGLNFLKEESETFARNIIGNTWNVMFSDIKDDETRDAAAKLSNTTIRMFKVQTEAENSGTSHTSESSGITHNKSKATSKSEGYKATRETLVQPEDLYLEAGDCLLIGKQQTIRLRMPFVEFSDPIKRMDEYSLTKFDDRKNLGDELWSKMANAN